MKKSWFIHVHIIQNCKILQIFAFEHKINKSYAKVSTHHEIIGFYTEDICHVTFVGKKFFVE